MFLITKCLVILLICYVLQVHSENYTIVLPTEENVVFDNNNDRTTTSSINLIKFTEESYLKTNQIVQLPEFNCDEFESGPVIILDEKTLYVPNIYSSYDENVLFLIGNEEERFPLRIPLNIRKNCSGESISIKLNDSQTFRDHSYFGVQVSDKEVLCRIDLPNNLTLPRKLADVGNISTQKNILVKKCCEYVLTEHGCLEKNVDKDFELTVYDNNSTHFSNTPLTNIRITMFHQNLVCDKDHDKYDYGLDEIKYLKNGSILMDYGFIHPKDYCFDFFFEDNDAEMKLREIVLICTPVLKSILDNESLNNITIVFQTLSCLGLLAICLIYGLLQEMRETVRGKIVIHFSGMLLLKFCFLYVARFSENKTCIVVGYIYQFCNISAHIWFGCFVMETLILIRDYLNKSNESVVCKKRYYLFLISYGFFSFIIIILLWSSNVHPSLPQYLVDQECNIENGSLSALYYQIPVLLFLVVSSVIIAIASYYAKTKEFEFKHKRMFKGMTENCIIIFGLMTIFWCLEVIAFYFPEIEGFLLAITVVQHLEGILLFTILVWYKPIRMKIKNAICKKEQRNQNMQLNHRSPEEPLVGNHP